MSRPQPMKVLANARQRPIRATCPPPQGQRRQGETFDDWFLRGILIRCENERDDVISARWGRANSADPTESSHYLTAAFYAQLRVRSTIERQATMVAFGVETMSMASAIVALDCPELFEESIATLHKQVTSLRWAADVQARRIRCTIWPLCKRREPGLRILAAAEAIPGPMPRRHVVALCRDIAEASLRRRRVHA